MAFPVVHGVTTFLEPPDDYDVDLRSAQSHYKLDHLLIFATLGPLALVCLSQRLYTKQFIAGGLTTDDFLVVFAFIAAMSMQSIQTWSISIGGLCHHAWEMPIQVFEKHMLSSYIVAPLFILCNGLSKTSLLLIYLKISPHRWYRISIWAAICLVVSYTVIIAGLLLFACKPISAAWDPYEMATGDCLDTAALYIAIAIANIASDVILFVIPIPTIVGLRMPLAQKIGAAGMFGVGSVTVATSIVRMVYLPSLLEATDIPWIAAPANVWSFVEVNLFIICSSMPTLRKFLKRFLPRVFNSHGSQPSMQTPRNVSSSKQSRHRTGYSQFDGVNFEMDDSSKQLKAVNVAERIPEDASEPVSRDGASEEGILGAEALVIKS